MTSPRHAFDCEHLRAGADRGLVGVDEVGRGALAGPVVAAAVWLDPGFYTSDWCRQHGAQIDDSKRLSPRRREQLCAALEDPDWQGLGCVALGWAAVAVIERENILGAITVAVEAALSALPEACQPPRDTAGHGPRLLVDGRPNTRLSWPHTGIVEGDRKSLAIALASIVAKVARDRWMAALEVTCPGYGFARHKGYGTAAHRAALRTLGPCAEHRRLFVRNCLGPGAARPAAA